MPFIKPKKYEEKANFMARFMNNAKMILEYSDPKKRYAVGVDVWKNNFM
jgi:hypothetical protein|tara:strand:+ start:1496 stop:1642 length:147 start_codon:yes stop_codon:yes gene_type:complete